MVQEGSASERDRADERERNRAEHEGTDGGSVGLLHGVSPRVRQIGTLGSVAALRSSLGSPSASCVCASPDRKTALSAIAKMLASSCVTTTIVMPRLSRSSSSKIGR